MVFPKPVSAKTRARLSLARIVSELGDLYGSEIGGFELEIDIGPEGNGNGIGDGAKAEVKAARQERYRGQFLKIFVSPPCRTSGIMPRETNTDMDGAGTLPGHRTPARIRQI